MAINQTTETEVELEMAERANLVSKYEALQRLKENKDFQVLVLDGYLKEQAVNQVSLLATPYVRQGGHRASIFEDLVAISAFEGYLEMIQNLGAPEVTDDDDDEE